MASAIGNKIWHWLQSGPLFIAMSIWLAIWTTTHLAPASWWLHVRYVQVGDVQTGHAVHLIVDREIRRDFYGQWSVTLRKSVGDHWEAIYCGTGNSEYRTDAILPNPLTLEWWADSECPSPLPPGRYQVATQWLIYPGGLWPPKQVRVLSNVFNVTEGPVAPRQD